MIDKAMIDNEPNAEPVMLPEALDLKAAQPLATQLLALRGSNVTLDASAVTHLGAQCLQILFSAGATWRADDAVLTIHDPNGTFAEQIAGLGDRFEPQSLKELCP
jgi:chemotaxis protein CheX